MIHSISLFYLSFTPLWISIIFLDFLSLCNNGNRNTVTEKYSMIVISIIFVLALCIHFFSFNEKKRDCVQKYRLESVHEEKAITAEYLLSYTLPLFAFDFTLWHHVVLFLVFFLNLGFLCIHYNRYTANIFLEIIGYRLYKCGLKNEDNKLIEKIVVSKERLINRKTEYIEIRPINNECSFDLTQWEKL